MTNWSLAVSQLADTGKLVHLSMRRTQYDVERIRAELLRMRRRHYDDELTAQARRVGCPGRVGRLENGAILSELNQQSLKDAQSIVNTYNADLAGAISYIRAETPTANRYVYAKRLGEWEKKRASWKNPQIAQYTESTARSKAQQDFRQYNDITGSAVLLPKKAVCPVCQGWVRRGIVPLRVAMNNPGPWHPFCPHAWSVQSDRIPASECRNLWMGS